MTARKRVKAKRATPRRRTAPRWTATEWEEATLAILARAGHRCEKCGDPLGNDLARHHRQKRDTGGDRLSNVVALHTRCHTWVHAHPEQARALGLIVSSHAPDPAKVPIWLPGLGGPAQWYLNDNGTRSVVP